MGQEFKVCQATYILLFYSGLLMGVQNIWCASHKGITTDSLNVSKTENISYKGLSATTENMVLTEYALTYNTPMQDDQMNTTSNSSNKETRVKTTSPQFSSSLPSTEPPPTSSNESEKHNTTAEAVMESSSRKIIRFLSSTTALTILQNITTITQNVTTSELTDITVPLIIGLLILFFIIITVICLAFVLRKKKRMRYSFDLMNKSSKEVDIPLNNVKG
ncbi:uncharacterized protein O3C94_000344 [Discoglossus pictus]